MELLVEGRNVEVPSDVRSYIQKKVGRLSRRLRSIDRVKVELTHEQTKAAQNRYVAQATLTVGNTMLRGEERGGDFYTAVDSVVDVLGRQIERFKGKRYGMKRQIGSRAKEFLISQEEPGKLVRVKRFPVKPMFPDEAAHHMELLGHDFFLFFNTENGEPNVIYRRKDGNYGLIQPELD